MQLISPARPSSLDWYVFAVLAGGFSEHCVITGRCGQMISVHQHATLLLPTDLVHELGPRRMHGLGGYWRRQDWPRYAWRDQPLRLSARYHPRRFLHPRWPQHLVCWRLLSGICGGRRNALAHQSRELRAARLTALPSFFFQPRLGLRRGRRERDCPLVHRERAQRVGPRLQPLDLRVSRRLLG